MLWDAPSGHVHLVAGVVVDVLRLAVGGGGGVAVQLPNVALVEQLQPESVVVQIVHDDVPCGGIHLDPGA